MTQKEPSETMIRYMESVTRNMVAILESDLKGPRNGTFLTFLCSSNAEQKSSDLHMSPIPGHLPVGVLGVLVPMLLAMKAKEIGDGVWAAGVATTGMRVKVEKQVESVEERLDMEKIHAKAVEDLNRGEAQLCLQCSVDTKHWRFSRVANVTEVESIDENTGEKTHTLFVEALEDLYVATREECKDTSVANLDYDEAPTDAWIERYFDAQDDILNRAADQLQKVGE